MFSNVQVYSEWEIKSISDYILNSLPFVIPVALIVSIIYFIDGIRKYGYWIYKDEE